MSIDEIEDNLREIGEEKGLMQMLDVIHQEHLASDFDKYEREVVDMFSNAKLKGFDGRFDQWCILEIARLRKIITRLEHVQDLHRLDR